MVNDNETAAAISGYRSGTPVGFTILFKFFRLRLIAFAEKSLKEMKIPYHQGLLGEIVAGAFLSLWQRPTKFNTIEEVENFLYTEITSLCKSPSFLDTVGAGPRAHNSLENLLSYCKKNGILVQKQRTKGGSQFGNFHQLIKGLMTTTRKVKR